MFKQIALIIVLLFIISEICKNESESFSDMVHVYWFHRPGCGYCTKMKNDWIKLKKIMPDNYMMHDIDTSLPQHAELSKKYGVNGVPHIVKVINGKHSVYNGNRSTYDMKRWLVSG